MSTFQAEPTHAQGAAIYAATTSPGRRRTKERQRRWLGELRRRRRPGGRFPMEDGKIQVTLGDGSVHEMEARDVDVFTKFIEREKVNSDGNEERDRLLMDSIDLIQLAYKSDQQKLLDLCRKAQGVERCGTGSAF